MEKRLLAAMFLLAKIGLQSEVIELPHYNWAQNIINAPSQSSPPGHQVLHFSSTDYPYQESPEGVAFVNRYLQNAKSLTSDADLLRFASDQVTLQGAYIELGVTTGKTINFIAALNPSKIIYGFDSFLGNPEEYEKDGLNYSKGTFGLKNLSQLPPVLNNVRLIQGSFIESLPYYIDKYLKDQPIAFLHVDCDLYSSSHTALQILARHIRPGTVIVFDDFYGYSDYEFFEYKALSEFLEETGYGVEYLAYNAMFEGVAVRILSQMPD